MKKVVEVDAQYPENLHDLHKDLPFQPETIKNEKVQKLAVNLKLITSYL